MGIKDSRYLSTELYFSLKTKIDFLFKIITGKFLLEIQLPGKYSKPFLPDVFLPINFSPRKDYLLIMYCQLQDEA